jgi:hypothetical protein
MMPLRVIWKGKEGCFKLVKKVVSQVQFEMGQIELLFASYADLYTPNQIVLTSQAEIEVNL